MGVDNVQAGYWLGPLTRKEAQSVFDEYAQALSSQVQEVMKLKAIISYIMQRFNITAEEIEQWVAQEVALVKAKDFAKVNEMKDALENPQPTAKVTLE